MQVRALECGYSYDCLAHIQDYVDLSGGEWDSNIEYYTPLFHYDADVEICAARTTGDYNLVIVGDTWEEIVQNGGHICDGGTDYGLKVCKTLGFSSCTGSRCVQP